LLIQQVRKKRKRTLGDPAISWTAQGRFPSNERREGEKGRIKKKRESVARAKKKRETAGNNDFVLEASNKPRSTI